eukprot:959288-Prorocentrum_minimum.AAC.3
MRSGDGVAPICRVHPRYRSVAAALGRAHGGGSGGGSGVSRGGSGGGAYRQLLEGAEVVTRQLEQERLVARVERGEDDRVVAVEGDVGGHHGGHARVQVCSDRAHLNGAGGAGAVREAHRIRHDETLLCETKRRNTPKVVAMLARRV